MKSFFWYLLLFIGLLNFSNTLSGQVVLNEVNVNPPGGTSSTIQSVKVCTASTSGTEYVELYNKSDCPIDISCYIIGWNQGTNALNGSFRIPSGTTIAAKSFISIGGPNSGATFNLYSYCSSTNLNTGNTRWYLNNGDGYVCLYNAAGSAVDLVYWTFNSGETSKYGTDSEISDGPTFIANPAGCSAFTGTMLPGPSSIPVSSGMVSYAGAYPSAPAVIGRTTDGGATWTNTLTASINGCNGTCLTVGPCVLPIELKWFNITCSGNIKTFMWETSSETNNAVFTIEQSADGTNFSSLKTVYGNNNSTTSKLYSEEILTTPEYKYFRLKQTDHDGAYSFSHLAYSDCINDSEKYSIYPNPFNNELFLNITTPNDVSYQIEIMDFTGRMIYSTIETGNSIFKKIDLPSMADGIYYYVIRIESEIKAQNKLIKYSN